MEHTTYVEVIEIENRLHKGTIETLNLKNSTGGYYHAPIFVNADKVKYYVNHAWYPNIDEWGHAAKIYHTEEFVLLKLKYG